MLSFEFRSIDIKIPLSNKKRRILNIANATFKILLFYNLIKLKLHKNYILIPTTSTSSI